MPQPQTCRGVILVGTGRSEDLSALTLLRQVLVVAATFTIIAVASRPVFRAALSCLSWAARAKAAELFLLCSLVLALGTAFAAAHAAGLSPPIGAFLAGMVVGESDFRHRIEDDLRPFRDVLVGLFFVTIGMQIDLAIIAAAPWSVLGWVLVFLVGKTMIAALLAKALGWPGDVAPRVGLILAHGGEFGLLLLTRAMAAGMVDPGPGYAMLVALAFTMGLAPILIQRSAAIAALAGPFLTAARHREEQVTAAHGSK